MTHENDNQENIYKFLDRLFCQQKILPSHLFYIFYLLVFLMEEIHMMEEIHLMIHQLTNFVVEYCLKYFVLYSHKYVHLQFFKLEAITYHLNYELDNEDDHYVF